MNPKPASDSSPRASRPQRHLTPPVRASSDTLTFGRARTHVIYQISKLFMRARLTARAGIGAVAATQRDGGANDGARHVRIMNIQHVRTFDDGAWLFAARARANMRRRCKSERAKQFRSS